MKTLIVLFRLKPGANRGDYEAWARATDLPVVRNLSSVENFDLYRTEGLFGSAGKPPFEYVEVIGIRNADRFTEEVGSATMRKVAAEFSAFADAPVFMLASEIGGGASHG